MKQLNTYSVSQNYVNTVMDCCGVIYSPQNVCPGFKWCCWLLCVEHDGEQVETVL
jgi:hypothetical protein